MQQLRSYIVSGLFLFHLGVIPFLKWRIGVKPSTSGATDSPPLTNSLTHGIVNVVATWGGVFLLLKDSHLWFLFEQGNTEQTVPILVTCGVGAITGAVLLLVTVICVGLTLTRLADWMFYRRRWTLPLQIAVVLGVGLSSLPVGEPLLFLLNVLLDGPQRSRTSASNNFK